MKGGEYCTPYAGMFFKKCLQCLSLEEFLLDLVVLYEKKNPQKALTTSLINKLQQENAQEITWLQLPGAAHKSTTLLTPAFKISW